MDTYVLLSIMISLIACSTGRKVVNFDERTAGHRRIAILPFDSKIKLKEKQRANISDEDLNQLELIQGKDVQDAMESYLIDKKVKVRIQSSNITNNLLTDAGVDFETINDQNYMQLADILGVDAIIVGYLETSKPMGDYTAMGLDFAKKLERVLLGTRFGSVINTTANRGYCELNLYDAATSDRLGSYDEQVSCPIGSNTRSLINTMMKKGANGFPY